MHYLITGHTGFKGSWLIQFLNKLKQPNDKISGIGLEPVDNSFFERTKGPELLTHDLRVDIRNYQELKNAFELIQPDVIIHLAAQALVIESYHDPKTTFETNALGTFNVMDIANKNFASKKNPDGKLLVITTDKVYDNRKNLGIPFVETDPLGPGDPYSGSKAAADIIAQTTMLMPDYEIPTAIARGGNVIGGGDQAKDRLMVDLMNGYLSDEKTLIRNPKSSRPWQHVLDCLYGYLTILSDLNSKANNIEDEIFNIGPKSSDVVEVEKIVQYLNLPVTYQQNTDSNFHEAKTLTLNSDKIKNKYGWQGLWDWKEAVDETFDWTKDAETDPIKATDKCLEKFISNPNFNKNLFNTLS